MHGLRQVLLYLKTNASAERPTYLKSRDIAETCDLTCREVGARLSHIGQSETIPISSERWSNTSSGATWAVELDSADELQHTLVEMAGNPEPKIRA